jgi:hypothetical protein
VDDAYAAIERAMGVARRLHPELHALEGLDGGDLLGIARRLLRAADERTKPEGERLGEYRDANRPAMAQHLLSPAPIHLALERVQLGRALARLREELGPDHPAVRRALGKESPQEVADRAVAETRLADLAVRRRLWEEGRGAAELFRDPMMVLAAALDPEARAVRRAHEDEVEAAVRRAHEVIADARFALRGRADYPDATFTLRLNVGEVKGWREGTREIPPFTTFAGAFERDTGKEPYALPPSWLAARPRLDLATPLNLVTTNDIVGGNSGSPVLSARGELVGIAFDGNIHSIGGEYGFDPALNRTVAVDARAVIEALGKIYGARQLLEELGVKGAPAPKGKR